VEFNNQENDAGQLKARLRTRSGTVSEVIVQDLSVGGCLVETRSLPMKVEDRVLIQLPELSYRPVSVVWMEEGQSGLAFEEPLYEPVVEHLKRSIA